MKELPPTIARVLLIAAGISVAYMARTFDLPGFYELGVALAGSQALKKWGDIGGLVKS